MDRKLKHQLMEKTASTLQQPTSIVEDTMAWMFRDVLKQLKIHTEVEISGWGTMLMSTAKLKRRIKRMEQLRERMVNKPQTEDMMGKIENVDVSLNYYKSRLYGMEENNGGVQDNMSSDGQGVCRIVSNPNGEEEESALASP